MKIKRYTSASMRLALDQVRAEQGPEAVILSSRRIDEGVEVIAAVDYDESLMAATQRQPELAGPVPRPTIAQTATANTATAQPAVRPAAEGAADAPYLAVRRELQDLRRLLEGGFANLSWSDRKVREPLKARILEQLSALDVAPDVALRLAAAAPRKTRIADPAQIPFALLAKYLPLVNDMTCVNGGVTAVVGPTGVGKTTTVAKLAARWCARHGNDGLALVSTDSYRIGAREQLLTYARILGVRLHSADSGAELAQVIERLRGKGLVLIDTAGFGPRDPRLAAQLTALKAGAPQARVLLALPAQGEAHALQDAAAAFTSLAPAACILTKIDEAASLGAALSTALRHDLPIAYLCNGQRVPEDLHAAHHRRIWLVRAAVRLKQKATSGPDEHYLARHFGGVQAHA